MDLRDLVWRSGAPVRSALIAFIDLYQAVLSGWLGGQCRFFPTCSSYAENAIREHGAVKGLGFAAWRLVRCNPYSRGGIDPAPASKRSVPAYDNVLRRVEEART